MEFTNLSKIITLLFACGCIAIGACNSSGNSIGELSDPCKKVFQPGAIRPELAKDFNINDIIALEKCGFVYKPTISFYSEIMASEQYPVPALLNELQSAADDHWSERLVFLLRSVIEGKRFEKEVMADRLQISQEVELVSKRVGEKVRERVRGHKEGIDIYFALQGTSTF